MIATVLRRAFWLVYDHPGRLMLGQLLWLLLASPFLLFVSWFAAVAFTAENSPGFLLACTGLYAVVLASPASLGFVDWFVTLAQGREDGLTRIWRGFRRFFWHGCALTFLLVLVNLAVVVATVVYTTQLGLPGWLSTALASFVIWVDIFVWGLAHYLPLLLVHQAAQGRDAIRKALLLLLDSPGLTLWLTISCVLLSLACALSGLGLLLLLMPLTCVIQWSAFQVLVEKYEIVQQLHHENIDPSRRLVMQRLREQWSTEPRRGWRNILKPWE